MPTTLEVRAVVLIAAASAALSGCSEPVAVPVPVVTLTAVAATNGQTAVAGSSLANPLTVRVETDGSPTAGVTVSWQASAGTLGRTSSVTGDDGITTTAWRLGADTGMQTATATVAGLEDRCAFHRERRYRGRPSLSIPHDFRRRSWSVPPCSR